mgnify:CR=1 FL=1
MRARSALLVPLAWILLAGCQPPAETPPVEAMPAGPVTGTVESADGVPIVYESRGAGDVALLFVHGWSCNREFWREQVDVFDDDYRVVTLDLGGHGASGTMRDPWRVRGLAAAVVDRAQRELVGVRVFFAGFDLGHDHVGKLAGHATNVVDLEPCSGQLVRQLIRGKVDRDPLFQPLDVELHRYTFTAPVS